MEIGIIVNIIILNQKGEILIIRRTKSNDVEPGLWDIPGGTLEQGEDPAMGVKRELKEETGLEVGRLKIINQLSSVDKKKNKQFVRLIFNSDDVDGEIILSPDEHDEYKWIKLEEISNYNCASFIKDLFK